MRPGDTGVAPTDDVTDRAVEGDPAPLRFGTRSRPLRDAFEQTYAMSHAQKRGLISASNSSILWGTSRSRSRQASRFSSSNWGYPSPENQASRRRTQIALKRSI